MAEPPASGAIHSAGRRQSEKPCNAVGGAETAPVQAAEGNGYNIEPAIDEPEIGGDSMKKDRYGIFKVIATCTSCGKPVVVNGPLAGPICPSCRKTLDIPPDIWKSILGSYIGNYGRTSPGEGDEGTIISGGLTIKYSTVRLPPPDPACPTCEENWDLLSVEDGADRRMVCRKCGRKAETYPAPSWLGEVVPQAKQTFFAEREVRRDENDVDAGIKPVALSCPQCGAGLLITAESERLIPCKYCNVDVYLPDDVWLRLHPSKQAKFWMVRFSG